MKTTDLKSGIYLKHDVEHNGKDPVLKVGDYMKISKYFCKELHSKLVRGIVFDQKIKKVHCTLDICY